MRGLCIPRRIFPAFVWRKKWLLANKKEGSAYKIINGVVMGRLASACWFTNIEHGRRHSPLQLMTMDDNIKYSKHKEVKGQAYKHYDNYDAIDVPFTDAIPSDYNGVMGVPISFLDKYCPEQFEILGIDRYIADNPKYGHRFTVNGKEIYARALIRKKQ